MHTVSECWGHVGTRGSSGRSGFTRRCEHGVTRCVTRCVTHKAQARACSSAQAPIVRSIVSGRCQGAVCPALAWQGWAARMPARPMQAASGAMETDGAWSRTDAAASPVGGAETGGARSVSSWRAVPRRGRSVSLERPASFGGAQAHHHQPEQHANTGAMRAVLRKSARSRRQLRAGRQSRARWAVGSSGRVRACVMHAAVSVVSIALESLAAAALGDAPHERG